MTEHDLGGAVVLELRRRRAKDTIELLADDALWTELKGIWLEVMQGPARELFDQGVAAAKRIRPRRRRRTGLRGLLERIFISRKAPDFLDPPADLLDNVAGDIFRSYMDGWWQQLERTTRDGLRTAIEDAAMNGTGTPGVVAAIEPLFGERRAQLIGVTETTRLFGRGAQATMTAAGVRTWIWQTDEDDAVCPICDDLDGEEFAMEEPFDPAHPGCRCFPLPSDDGAGPEEAG
jgi:SPP1 gp7 family putative phage head morphogenesis protein